jgi:peptidoglycan/LPS O-acetylase OafA/YrhL
MASPPAGSSTQDRAFEERLQRAFSLRRNLRALLHPAEGHLRPLDGLRALSILWVVAFHAGWYAALHIPVQTYAALVYAPWMVPLWRGDFGVDVFFVLSGFLIAGMLAGERERTGRLRLGLFYGRRLMRLWPALGVAVLIYAEVIDDRSDMLWANLLYISNFIPIVRAAMGWTWSLAIEEQFYLVCPWLVRALAPARPRGRLLALGALALLLCGVGAWVAAAGRFHAKDAEIVVDRDFLRWARGFDHLYVKPWMRAGALLAGAAAAYVYRMPAAMEALARRRVLPVVGLGAALLVAIAAMHWPLWAAAPRWLEVTYLATFRTVFGAAVAYVLLLSLSRHPVGLFLGRVLSARILHPFAQLAYAAYLLNPIVATVVHRALSPLVWKRGVPPIPLFLPVDALLTFLAAAVLYLLVERPFMELRPRAEADPPQAAAPDGASA